MKNIVLAMTFLLVLGGCSTYEKGEVADSSDNDIKIKIAVDAAVRGVDTRRQAGEYCAHNNKKAVWYGHDRDGNMHYKCE